MKIAKIHQKNFRSISCDNTRQKYQNKPLLMKHKYSSGFDIEKYVYSSDFTVGQEFIFFILPQNSKCYSKDLYLTPRLQQAEMLGYMVVYTFQFTSFCRKKFGESKNVKMDFCLNDRGIKSNKKIIIIKIRKCFSNFFGDKKIRKWEVPENHILVDEWGAQGMFISRLIQCQYDTMHIVYVY